MTTVNGSPISLNCAGSFAARKQILMIHSWSDERSLTRRILGVREQSEDRIVLDVRRFGRSNRTIWNSFEAAAPPFASLASQLRVRVQRTVSRCFPDATIDPLTTAPDLKNSISIFTPAAS